MFFVQIYLSEKIIHEKSNLFRQFILPTQLCFNVGDFKKPASTNQNSIQLQHAFHYPPITSNLQMTVKNRFQVKNTKSTSFLSSASNIREKSFLSFFCLLIMHEGIFRALIPVIKNAAHYQGLKNLN